MWAGRLDNWKKCDVCVNPNAKHDPHNHGIEDGTVDVLQQNEEASEEKEDGKM